MPLLVLDSGRTLVVIINDDCVTTRNASGRRFCSASPASVESSEEMCSDLLREALA